MADRNPRLWVLVLPALIAAGCLGGGPKTQYYTLGVVDAGETIPVASRPELGLAVGPLEFPRYLDRHEIVTRDGAHRLALSNAHRWAGSLRTDVLRVVADDLGELLGTPRVVAFPNEPTFRLDYRVLLDIREFEGVPGESVALRARWTIVSPGDGQALAVEDFQVVEPTGSVSFGDLVAAQRAALGTLTREIAAMLVALPASTPGAK